MVTRVIIVRALGGGRFKMFGEAAAEVSFVLRGMLLR